MSRIFTPLVGPMAGKRRLNARQRNERLAWFAAAYVLVAVCATTVAGEFRGLAGDPPTSPPSRLMSTAGGKLADVRLLRRDAREVHSAPL